MDIPFSKDHWGEALICPFCKGTKLRHTRCDIKIEYSQVRIDFVCGQCPAHPRLLIEHDGETTHIFWRNKP